MGSFWFIELLSCLFFGLLFGCVLLNSLRQWKPKPDILIPLEVLADLPSSYLTRDSFITVPLGIPWLNHQFHNRLRVETDLWKPFYWFDNQIWNLGRCPIFGSCIFFLFWSPNFATNEFPIGIPKISCFPRPIPNASITRFLFSLQRACVIQTSWPIF